MAKSYLEITGRLEDDNSYVPRRGYETKRERAQARFAEAQECSSECEIISYDEDNEIINRINGVASNCGCSADRSIRAYLPLSPRAVAYEIRIKGAIVYRSNIAKESPVVKFLKTVVAANKGFELIWKKVKSEGVTYDVFIEMENGSRRLLARHLKSNSLINKTNTVFYGKYRFVVRVSDGVRSSEDVSKYFKGREDSAAISIAMPAVETHYNVGDLLDFYAQGADYTTSSFRSKMLGSIRWTLGGKLVHEGSLQGTVQLTDPGEHEIEVTCQYGEKTLQSKMTVVVGPATSEYKEWLKEFGGVSKPDALRFNLR